MSVEFCEGWRERRKQLFANVANWDKPIVCVEHEVFIPCRSCMYENPADVPYSNDPDDVRRVQELHYGIVPTILRDAPKRKGRR